MGAYHIPTATKGFKHMTTILIKGYAVNNPTVTNGVSDQNHATLSVDFGFLSSDFSPAKYTKFIKELQDFLEQKGYCTNRRQPGLQFSDLADDPTIHDWRIEPSSLHDKKDIQRHTVDLRKPFDRISFVRYREQAEQMVSEGWLSVSEPGKQPEVSNYFILVFDSHPQKKLQPLIVNGKSYRNITVIDSDRQPVAIITADEITTLKGYQVLFDVGED